MAVRLCGCRLTVSLDWDIVGDTEAVSRSSSMSILVRLRGRRLSASGDVVNAKFVVR